MENRFDELAKALAEGVARREALRRFVGGLAGAVPPPWAWDGEPAALPP